MIVDDQAPVDKPCSTRYFPRCSTPDLRCCPPQLRALLAAPAYAARRRIFAVLPDDILAAQSRSGSASCTGHAIISLLARPASRRFCSTSLRLRRIGRPDDPSWRTTT